MIGSVAMVIDAFSSCYCPAEKEYIHKWSNYIFHLLQNSQVFLVEITV